MSVRFDETQVLETGSEICYGADSPNYAIIKAQTQNYAVHKTLKAVKVMHDMAFMAAGCRREREGS